MDLLQFSLFFAAIVVAYILVHLRLARFARFESYLRELGELRVVPELMRRLQETLDKAKVERLEANMAPLHADLRDVLTALHKLERAVQEVADNLKVVREAAATSPMAAATAPAGPTPRERVRELVERAVFAQGYRNLRIVGDLIGARLEGECTVQVEAERDGMPCKGKVVTCDGAVRDLDLRPAAAMFP